jgi:hypothetical protein
MNVSTIHVILPSLFRFLNIWSFLNCAFLFALNVFEYSKELKKHEVNEIHASQGMSKEFAGYTWQCTHYIDIYKKK